MVESVTVRIMLAVYFVATLIAVGIIWWTAAAPDTLSNGGIILASLLTLLVAVVPYFSKVTLELKFNYVLFYDSTNNSLVTGGFANTYASQYVPMFTIFELVRNAYDLKDLSEFQ